LGAKGGIFNFQNENSRTPGGPAYGRRLFQLPPLWSGNHSIYTDCFRLVLKTTAVKLTR